MKRWTSVEELAREVKHTVVAVGNFDGVHRGHQEIVRRLLEAGRRRKSPTVALTFEPHPAVTLGMKPPPLLTTPAQRADLMEPLGVDHFVTFPFTPEVAQMSARAFLERALLEPLGMKVLCIGPTTHLGRAREGTPARLGKLSVELDFELNVAEPSMHEGTIISSSRIRELLGQGNVECAALLLGHPYVTLGRVVKGEGRGSTLGFPTANLEPVVTMLPGRGVYATRISSREGSFGAATNVGTRPTLHPEATREVVESHLLHFQGSLLGERIRIEWLRRLRDETRFDSPAALAKQIAEDCQRADHLTREQK